MQTARRSEMTKNNNVTDTNHSEPVHKDPPTLSPGRLLRLKDVLQIIPISKSSFYQGIKTGKYPPPVKLGERTSAWRSDLLIPIVEKGV